MSEQAFTALYLIINLFATYTLSKLFILFFEHTQTRKWVLILSYFIYFALNSALYFCTNEIWINATFNIGAFYLLSLNYRAPVWKKVVFIPIIFLIPVMAEIAVIIIFRWLGLDLFTTGKNTDIIWALLILNVAIFLVVSMLLHRRTFQGIKEINVIKTFPIFVLSLCILLLAGVLPKISAKDEALTFLSAVTFIVMTIFIYVFVDYMAKVSREQARSEIFENQANQYKKQMDLLLNQYDNIRTIRHNISGQIQLIYSLIDNEKYDAAKTFIGDLTKMVHGNERLLNTGFVELDCLVNYKCNYARTLNIDIGISAKIEEEIKIKHYEYISVIDNLMDNAIEAVTKINSNENKKIEVVLSAFKGLAYIQVSNPFINKIKQTHNTFSTSKQDGDNHGFGLQYVKSIVNKYDGKIQITYDAEFTVKIFMCNIDKPD